MRVDLSGGDAGMSEHFLYRPEICSVFNQMGGKSVPESMRTDVF